VKRLASLAAALCLALGAGAATNATVTRIYAGTVKGSVAMLPVTADVFAEVTGTPEAFAAPSGSTFIVRGWLAKPPNYAAAAALTNWSNFIRVHVSNATTFVSDAVWEDGHGKVAAEWPSDFSSITAEAAGEVTDPIPVGIEIERTRLILIETRTNVPAVVAVTNAPTSGDAIDLAKGWKRYGQHKVELAKMRVTRQLYSAKNLGDTVRLSFEPLGWPTHDGKKVTDGGVVIIWEEGTGYAGGFFDAHGVGQTGKTQENIFGGYLEGHQPPKGKPVWYCIVNWPFTERTTIQPGGFW
jgi:hypothetical protein